MSDLYKEAFDAYYSLKRQYDNQVERQKRKIIANTNMSLREKQNAIKNIDVKCINCKKSGGTIFKHDGKRLSAVCGNVEDPCSLHIDIERGTYSNIYVLQRLFKNSLVKVLKFSFGTINETIP